MPASRRAYLDTVAGALAVPIVGRRGRSTSSGTVDRSGAGPAQNHDAENRACQEQFKTGFENGLDEGFTGRTGQVPTTTDYAAADDRALFMAADDEEWESELRTTALFCGPTVARTKVRYVVNGGGGTNFLFGFGDPDPDSFTALLVSTNVNDTVDVREWDEDGTVSVLGALPVTVDTSWRALEVAVVGDGLTVNIDGTVRQFATALDWPSREKTVQFRVKTLVNDGDDVAAAFDSATVRTR